MGTWEATAHAASIPCQCIQSTSLIWRVQEEAVVEEAVAATLELESYSMPSGGQSGSGAGRRAGCPGDPGCSS